MDSEARGNNGYPEGWCRYTICGTDDISHFELDLRHGRRREIVEENDESETGTVVRNGMWEAREIFDVTKEEILNRVWNWLESVVGEGEDGDCLIEVEESNG